MWSIVIVGFLVVQFGSDLGAAKFFISHFTFDPQTGWYRVAIWDFGTASVLNHPLLGIGLADWERPRWMASDSVDNFWLLTAMRYGIPSLVLLLGSCIWMMVAVARAKGADRSIEICRLAYLICMTTFLFVGVTIHFRTQFMRGSCSSWEAVHGCWIPSRPDRRGPPKAMYLQEIACHAGMPASSPGGGIELVDGKTSKSSHPRVDVTRVRRTSNGMLRSFDR